MVHDDRYETHDGSEMFILQIVREICRFVQKFFVPWYRNWATRVQNWGKKNKKPPILFTFRKVVFFLAVSPKDGAGGRGERLGVLQRWVGRGSSKEGMAL